MASEVNICNLALSAIGKASINSIDEPSAEAAACKLHYSQARDVLLQSYDWSFARRIMSLAELASDWTKWGYRYQYPSDCLKLRRIIDEADLSDDLSFIPYEIIGSSIYCNLSPAFADYTKKITDPTIFPPLVVDALAALLASRIATPLTRNPKIMSDQLSLASNATRIAQTADANNVRESSDFASSTIRSRD